MVAAGRHVDPEVLTGPVEDYLKAIYELASRDGVAATSDVANALGVEPNVLPLSPPRVWGLIQAKRENAS